MKKRLIVCSDGTWQSTSSGWPTNIQKIAQAITPTASDGTPQVVYYGAGVGAEAENFLQKASSGLSGEGLDTLIQDAYRFLVFNYEPGDEIYLFGFSRGAYTVRSLGGLLYAAGILKRKYLHHLPEAYVHYRNRVTRPSDRDVYEFRQKYSWPSTDPTLDDEAQSRGYQPTVNLLSCWDTVGALGIPDLIPLLPFDNLINRKYEFHDTLLNRRVKHALHALAIDELRGPFTPTPMLKSDDAPTTITELWFAGTHAGIGGGDKALNDLSNITLDWMINAIQNRNLGLEFSLENIDDVFKRDSMVDFDNRVSGIYLALPHHVRSLDRSTRFHAAVSERWQGNVRYRPSNVIDVYGENISVQDWANLIGV